MVTAVRWPVRSATKRAVGDRGGGVAVPRARAGRRPGGHRRQPVLQFRVVGADEPVPPVDGHPAVMPSGPPHGHLADVREGHRAGLADDLAADVVAVSGVDEQFVVDKYAIGHLEDQDQRILQVGGGLAAAARLQHAGGRDLLAEQPPDQVDLVHRGVADDHLRGEAVRRHGRIAVRAVHQQRRPDAAVFQRGLHGLVARVVAAHEADLDAPAAGRHLGVHDPQAGVAGRRERLLAEHRLAGLDRRDHLLLVGGTPGRDEHRVDGVVRNELGGRGVHGRPG